MPCTLSSGCGRLWHLGGLIRIRADGAATDGTLAVVEERARPGYGTPAHVHTREDETQHQRPGSGRQDPCSGRERSR
jgi:hypothetical protein